MPQTTSPSPSSQNQNLLPQSQVAQMLGVKESAVLQYSYGPGRKIQPVRRPDGLYFEKASVETYMQQREEYFRKHPNRRPSSSHSEKAMPPQENVQMHVVPASLLPASDDPVRGEEQGPQSLPRTMANPATMLQRLVLVATDYLVENRLPVDISSLVRRIITEEVQVWRIETPIGPLDLVALDDEVQVVSTVYQHQLEAQNRDLRDRLWQAEYALKTLSKTPWQANLDGFSAPVPVTMAQTTEGFLVRCRAFGRVAEGPTEEEAMAMMRQEFWGYVRWLDTRRPEEKANFTSEQKEHYQQLRELLADHL